MRRILMLTALLGAAFAGCLGDGEGGGPGDDGLGPSATPSFENAQPGSVTAFEHVARLVDAEGAPAPSAGGIWPYGDHVFGSGLGWGMWIADISDPEEPVLLFNTTGDDLTGFARDADVVPHANGRLSLVLATQNDGMHIWDVTDPADPQFLARTVYEDDAGNPIPNHNIATVPGTELVFNSRSAGAGSTNDLVDVSDPADPVVLGTYGTHGCHDIAFFGEYGGDKFRAYCPGIERTEIWDLDSFDATAGGDFGIGLVSFIESADHPLLIPGHPLPNTIGYPLRTLHHLAVVDNEAEILIIGDEHNGGGAPGMCLLYESTTGLSTPLGALWFFDISDEENPEMLSWISPPMELTLPPSLDPSNTNPLNPAGVLNNLPSCTAHFGTMVPGEDKFVISWYHAGVLLVDFSDPATPVIADQWTADDENVWDARVHHGYVFTGDTGRGMDILRLV